MRKQLYLDIVKAIKTITDESEQQLFKHYDLWNRQVEFLAKETPFKFPAIFIEFSPIDWQTLSEDQTDQSCNPVIRIHIVTEYFFNTAENNEKHLEALELLDLPDVLFDKFCQLNSEGVLECERIRSITNHDHEVILDSIEEYKFIYINS